MAGPSTARRHGARRWREGKLQGVLLEQRAFGSYGHCPRYNAALYSASATREKGEGKRHKSEEEAMTSEETATAERTQSVDPGLGSVSLPLRAVILPRAGTPESSTSW
jgi:hypothetical protein